MSLARLIGFGLAIATLLVLLAFAAPVPSALAAPPTEFGHEGSGAGEFEEAKGIALQQDNGDVYLADRNNNRVERFSGEGEFELAWGWGVADGAAVLETCGPQAAPPTTTCRAGLEGTGSGQFTQPEGVAVDNDPAGPSHGDVYVIDSRNARVEKFGPAGEFILMLGGGVNASTLGNICLAGESCQGGAQEGTGPGEFDRLNGRAIATGPSGDLYVGDENRVQRFSPGGALEAQVALPGSGFTENLAVDAAGDLYVKSSEPPGVRKYDPSGTELGSPRDAGGEPSAIALGAADRLYVNDSDSSEAHHILTYDPSGTQLSSFDGGHEGGSRGIAYSDAGPTIYVLNAAAVRIVSPPAPGPYVFAEAAGEVQSTTATLGGQVNPEGGEETTYHFEYGETELYGQETAESATLEPVNELQTMTLKATSGSYLLRFEGEATVEIPFNAEGSQVQADLEAVAAIGAGNVSVSGPAGGPYEIEFTGALGNSDQPQLEAESVNLKEATEVEGEERIKAGSVSVATTRQGADLFADRPVSESITGLQPRTTYHFRLVATNAAHETTDGPDQSFETLPPVSIDSTSVAQVSATSARLQTELNPHGLPSSYHFEYDTRPYLQGEAPHGTNAPVPDASAGNGNSDAAFSQLVEALAPGTTYHFRVVAENALGTVQGPDRSFATEGAASSILPDGRGWEMVSPPEKNGVPLEPISRSGGIIQAAADGTGLAYFAKGATDPQPAGNRSFANSQLLAQRSPAGGWSSQDITTPHQAPVGLHAVSEYHLFSTDLAAAAVEPDGATPLSPQATERTPYLRRADGTYTPLVNPANVPLGTEFGGVEEKPETFGASGVQFQTGTPDLSHLLLTSPLVLSRPPFSPEPGQTNIYEWAAGTLSLISQVPTGSAVVCGGSGPACTPAPAQVGEGGRSMRGAISTDGSRVFFTAQVNGAAHLYVRDLSRGETLQLDAIQGGSEGSPHPQYEAASADGSRVFFTEIRQLTADSTAKNQTGQADLYACQIGVTAGHLACSLSDLSIDSHPGQHADVQNAVLGTAKDGSIAYFVANGQLAAGAVPGACAENSAPDTSCNLYSVDTASDEVKLVAVLARADANDWIGNISGGGGVLTEQTARVSPNGRYLAFMSRRPLTGYDNRDARSGQPAQEVYIYDSQTATLRCASCNPSGARPFGLVDDESGRVPFPLVDRLPLWPGQTLAASIPGWTPVSENHALYQSRYLSDSGRLFFNAADALVPQDSNATQDVYQYEPPGVGGCTASSPSYGQRSGGCIDLISSGTSGEESAFLDASESGDDVFFLTASKLAAQDVDTALDVYDAHVCSAALPCPPPPPPTQPACEGDACQSPAVAPEDETPASSAFHGPGNLNPAKSKKKHAKKHKGKHHKKRAQKRANSNRGGGR